MLLALGLATTRRQRMQAGLAVLSRIRYAGQGGAPATSPPATNRDCGGFFSFFTGNSAQRPTSTASVFLEGDAEHETPAEQAAHHARTHYAICLGIRRAADAGSNRPTEPGHDCVPLRSRSPRSWSISSAVRRGAWCPYRLASSAGGASISLRTWYREPQAANLRRQCVPSASRTAAHECRK